MTVMLEHGNEKTELSFADELAQQLW